MTTCEEVQKLLEESEIENIKFELKSSKILKNDNWKDNLAKEIVAFANKNGGKVIIGLQNNGTFDGEADYDVDELKGDIDNIIHNKISPIINYNFEFLKCNEGDLSIISVEKKKDIPHAYIVKREGPEIKNRIYYYRTPHGKRLVSDKQLDSLFNEKDLNFIEPVKKVEIKPDLELINEYLNMIKNSQLSSTNLVPMLNHIHNEFAQILTKEDFTENELDIINKYIESVDKYLLSKNNDLIKRIILGTVKMLILKPKFSKLVNSVNYHNFKKLYESGYNISDIILILYKCGYFKSIPTEIYKAIDKKDIDTLHNFRNLLNSTNIEENIIPIIKELRLKKEKLSSSSDIKLIEMIESIISSLVTLHK